MIKHFLQMGGVASVEEFYNKFPTENDFKKAHPEAFQTGGNAEQEQLTQLIQAFAQLSGNKPEDVMAQLQQMKPEQQQQAVQQMAQAVQEASQQGGGGQQIPTAQTGGVITEPKLEDYNGDEFAYQKAYDEWLSYLNSQQVDNTRTAAKPSGKTTTTKTEITNGPLYYNDTFQKLNTVMDLTQGVAGSINEFKNRRDEEEKLRKARYNQSQYNVNEEGVNNIPTYFQFGGDANSIVDYLKNQGEDSSFNSRKMFAVV